MQAKQVQPLATFNEEKMAKHSLFDTERMFFDLYCLLPGQAQKIHAHEASDKVYYVLEGQGHFTVGTEEASHGAGWAVFAPAGEQHGVRNEGPDRLMLLVTMAPKP